MSELLFEIGCEELPASYARNALAELPGIVAKLLTERGLDVDPKAVRVAGTPRRLAVGIESLPDQTPRKKKKMKGPPEANAFKDGKPTKAAEGFAQKCGVEVSKLKVEDGYVTAEVEEGGRATAEILAEALPKVIESIPFPKVMRWGALEAKFARTVRWILASFGGKTVAFEWGGTKSGTKTHGHRFLAPAAIEATSWKAYLTGLEKAHVIADPEKRRARVEEMSMKAAKEAGGTIEPDEALLDTVSFLVEEPHPIVGSFDKALLDLPKEVIVTPMKHHQRYFPVVDAGGKLKNAFVTIANVPPKDPKVVARGNERVLRARLADAKFFFDEDLKKPLAEMADELSKVTFHAKLGSQGERVARIQALASAIAQAAGVKIDAATLEKAAKLSKADLKSKMVYEFPELQGTMGREYALRAGEPAEVANAIAEHYEPRLSGGAPPKSDLGAVISLADRIDTLAGIFGIGDKPTGSADPFGLRRHALAIIAIVRQKKWGLHLGPILAKAASLHTAQGFKRETGEVVDFLRGRLDNLLREEGLPYDAVDAALSARLDDVNEAIARAKAIADLKKDPDLEPVAIGFKRARNILADKKAEPFLGATVDSALFADDSEKKLHSAAAAAAEAIRGHASAGRWNDALRETVKLRKPIDAFYEKVMVMDKDERVKKNRLALLKEVVDVFDGIADFTKLVAT